MHLEENNNQYKERINKLNCVLLDLRVENYKLLKLINEYTLKEEELDILFKSSKNTEKKANKMILEAESMMQIANNKLKESIKNNDNYNIFYCCTNCYNYMYYQ